MRFSDIAGHQEAKSSLRNMVDTGRIPHAILLAGHSGIGKFRLARAMAQYIHCSHKKDGEPCGVCPSCLQHQSINNPDLHFVYPIIKKEGAQISKDVVDIWKEYMADHSYMPTEVWNEYLKTGNSQPAIFVNESEDILFRASISSFQENYKIFLIWLPEKMRIEAANKLLKVVEEPFEDTIFIFVSNDASKILPTIFSRTHRINLNPVSADEIAAYLMHEKGVERYSAQQAARMAEGSIGKAEILTCHPEESRQFMDIFKEMMRNSYALRIRNLKTISEEIAAWGREKIMRFLRYTSHMMRENFIYNLRMPDISMMSAEEEEFSKKFSPFIHEGNVECMSEEIDRAITDIERNGNAKIVLFDLLLYIAQYIRVPRKQT